MRHGRGPVQASDSLNIPRRVAARSGVGPIPSNATLTAIRSVRVGHAQDLRRRTGTTVVLLDPPAMAFSDSRGGWPGTYDTAASDLGKTIIERHALLLAGGDVYGFDAVRGIRRYLLENKLASRTGGGKMPSIMGTNIYDLEFADTEGLDYTDLGYEACANAGTRPVAQGNVGAGTGATVGPFFGRKGGTKGGLGSSAAKAGPWTVGAVVVTNCVGNVYDPFANRTVGGTLRDGGKGSSRWTTSSRNTRSGRRRDPGPRSASSARTRPSTTSSSPASSSWPTTASSSRCARRTCPRTATRSSASRRGRGHRIGSTIAHSTSSITSPCGRSPGLP